MYIKFGVVWFKPQFLTYKLQTTPHNALYKIDKPRYASGVWCGAVWAVYTFVWFDAHPSFLCFIDEETQGSSVIIRTKREERVYDVVVSDDNNLMFCIFSS